MSLKVYALNRTVKIKKLESLTLSFYSFHPTFASNKPFFRLKNGFQVDGRNFNPIVIEKLPFSSSLIQMSI